MTNISSSSFIKVQITCSALDFKQDKGRYTLSVYELWFKEVDFELSSVLDIMKVFPIMFGTVLLGIECPLGLERN
jgi:hypothetical protein